MPGDDEQTDQLLEYVRTFLLPVAGTMIAMPTLTEAHFRQRRFAFSVDALTLEDHFICSKIALERASCGALAATGLVLFEPNQRRFSTET